MPDVAVALRPPPDEREPVTLGQLVPGLGEIQLLDAAPPAPSAPPAPPAPPAVEAVLPAMPVAAPGAPPSPFLPAPPDMPPTAAPAAPPAPPAPVAVEAPVAVASSSSTPTRPRSRAQYVEAMGHAHAVLVALGDLPVSKARAAILIALEVLEGLEA